MKRFWSFALVACLLLALTPVDHGTTLDTGQQEVVALVAHISASVLPAQFFTNAQSFEISQRFELPTVETMERDRSPSAAAVAAWSTVQHADRGYNVLKMPDARGNLSGPSSLVALGSDSGARMHSSLA